MNISRDLTLIELIPSFSNGQNTEQNKSPPSPQEDEEFCKRVYLPNLSTFRSASRSSKHLLRTIEEVRFSQSLQNQIPGPNLNFQTLPSLMISPLFPLRKPFAPIGNAVPHQSGPHLIKPNLLSNASQDSSGVVPGAISLNHSPVPTAMHFSPNPIPSPVRTHPESFPEPYPIVSRSANGQPSAPQQTSNPLPINQKQPSFANGQKIEGNKRPLSPQEEEKLSKRVCLLNSSSLSALPTSEYLVKTIRDAQFSQCLQNEIPSQNLSLHTWSSLMKTPPPTMIPPSLPQTSFAAIRNTASHQSGEHLIMPSFLKNGSLGQSEMPALDLNLQPLPPPTMIPPSLPQTSFAAIGNAAPHRSDRDLIMPSLLRNVSPGQSQMPALHLNSPLLLFSRSADGQPCGAKKTSNPLPINQKQPSSRSDLPPSEYLVRTIREARFSQSLQNEIPSLNINLHTWSSVMMTHVSTPQRTFEAIENAAPDQAGQHLITPRLLRNVSPGQSQMPALDLNLQPLPSPTMTPPLLQRSFEVIGNAASHQSGQHLIRPSLLRNASPSQSQIPALHLSSQLLLFGRSADGQRGASQKTSQPLPINQKQPYFANRQNIERNKKPPLNLQPLPSPTMTPPLPQRSFAAIGNAASHQSGQHLITPSLLRNASPGQSQMPALHLSSQLLLFGRSADGQPGGSQKTRYPLPINQKQPSFANQQNRYREK